MRGRVLHLFWAVGLLAICAPALGAAPKPQNVILIGWGGARRVDVDASLQRRELPNLQKLIDRGHYVRIDAEGSADTKAGWTQILTGYLPDVTGVYTNDRYQPVPSGLSVFERLEKHFGTDAFVTVAVIGSRQHLGAIDPPRQAPRQDGSDEAGTVDRVLPGSPYYNMHRALEVWEYGLGPDEKVGPRALELLEKYKDKPFFIFIYFAGDDKADDTARARHQALVSDDRWTGQIADKVAELGLADKTQIYVSGDQSFLATTNQAVTRAGRRQDIAATILEAFGIDQNEIAPPLAGISLTRADNRPPIQRGTAGDQQMVVEVQEPPRRPDVVFVPTPQKVVDAMLRLAQVKKSDVVYDLGCGDGRIVVTAAKRFGCRAFGFDIDPARVAESRENVENNGVGDLVTIQQKDIFTLDLSRADVVTLYLLPSLNVKLIPQLERLKPGSRIVSHDFDMKGVQPDQEVRIETNDTYISHTVYLWTCPLKKVDPNGINSEDND